VPCLSTTGALGTLQDLCSVDGSEAHRAWVSYVGQPYMHATIMGSSQAMKEVLEEGPLPRGLRLNCLGRDDLPSGQAPKGYKLLSSFVRVDSSIIPDKALQEEAKWLLCGSTLIVDDQDVATDSEIARVKEDPSKPLIVESDDIGDSRTGVLATYRDGITVLPNTIRELRAMGMQALPAWKSDADADSS